MSLEFLSKGTVRKSTLGGTRESNFDFRYAHYTKINKLNQAEQVDNFSFTAGAMAKTGLNLSSKAAAPVMVDGNICIAVLSADHEAANFFKPAKASAKNGKSKVCTVPTITNALAEAGLLDPSFSGSQYFNLELISEGEEAKVYKIVASEVAPKAYVAGDEDNA